MKKGEKLLTAHEVLHMIYGRGDIGSPKTVHKYATHGVRIRAGMAAKARRKVYLEGATQTPRGVMWPQSCVERFVAALQTELQVRAKAAGVVVATDAAAAIDAGVGAAAEAEIERNIQKSRKTLHPTANAERTRRRRTGNSPRAA